MQNHHHQHVGAAHIWRAASNLTAEETQHARHSWWGPMDATLDWCEDNFVITYAIAEFFNTTTNLVMVGLGLYGLYLGVKHQTDFRAMAGFLGLLIVGLGSIAFHGTLRFDAQLVDELPMLWADVAFVYALTPKTWRLSAFHRGMLVTFLSSAVVLVSFLYVKTRNVLLFEASFGLVATIIVFRSGYWAYTHAGPKHGETRGIIWTATMMLACAYALWMIDNNFCDSLRGARAKMGPVLAPLLQFHAWWHVLSGGATYLLGVFVTIHENENNKGDEFMDVELNTHPSFRLSKNVVGMPVFVRDEGIMGGGKHE